MKYFKAAQPVPGKGMAFTLYELNDKDEVVRIETHIPETGEITLYPKPKMKSLFQPERLDASNAEEFNYIWETGLEQQADK